jgi:hypothetical protein
LSFDELTKADIGVTYRFTFRIKASYADGEVLNAATTVGLMRMNGTKFESNTAKANNSTAATVATNG